MLSGLVRCGIRAHNARLPYLFDHHPAALEWRFRWSDVGNPAGRPECFHCFDEMSEALLVLKV